MQRKKPKAKATPPSSVKVDRKAVIKLAHELYLRRGGADGHDVEDWLTAERILIEQQKRSAPHRKASGASRRMKDK